MKKILAVLAILFVFASFSVIRLSLADQRTSKDGSSYEVTQLIRYIVKNHEGQYLGRIQDFAIDSEGRVSFAIITQPGMLGIRGKPVAVPFEALSLGSEKNEFVLDMSWEKFASMPTFDKTADLNNRRWAEQTYRSFGLQPYWTDKGE